MSPVGLASALLQVRVFGVATVAGVGVKKQRRLQSASIWPLLCRRSRDIRVCAGMARPARGRSLAGGDFFLSRLGAEADIIISIPTSNPTAHMTLAIAKGLHLPPSAYSFWVLSPRETVYSIQTDAARRDAYYSGPMRDGEKTNKGLVRPEASIVRSNPLWFHTHLPCPKFPNLQRSLLEGCQGGDESPLGWLPYRTTGRKYPRDLAK